MFTTAEAAERVGVCKNTLLRWIKLGLVDEVSRDWRQWRVWSQDDVDRAKAFRDSYHSQSIPRPRRRRRPAAGNARESLEVLAKQSDAWARRLAVSA